MKSQTILTHTNVQRIRNPIFRKVAKDLMECYETLIYGYGIEVSSGVKFTHFTGINEEKKTHYFLIYHEEEWVWDHIREIQSVISETEKLELIILDPDEDLPEFIQDDQVNREYQEMIIC